MQKLTAVVALCEWGSAGAYHFLHMMREWRSQYWFSFAVCLFCLAALLALTRTCVWFRLDFSTAGFLLLVGIILISTQDGFVGSALLSVVTVGCLTDFFSPPLFFFRLERQDNLVALFAFLTSSIIITGLASKIRRLSEDESRHPHAELARYARVAILGELTTSIAREVNHALAWVVSSGDACGAIEFLTEPFREQSLLDGVNAGIERDRTRRPDARNVLELQRRFELLTPRERIFARSSFTGLPNKKIAAQLKLSEMTVEVAPKSRHKKMEAT